MYKEIQMGSGAKDFLIYAEIRKFFPIYEEAVSHIYMTLHPIPLNFLIYVYEENSILLFISAQSVWLRLHKAHSLAQHWQVHWPSLNICAFPHILGSPSSYMTLQPSPIWISWCMRKISFLFYQCDRFTYPMPILLHTQVQYQSDTKGSYIKYEDKSAEKQTSNG